MVLLACAAVLWVGLHLGLAGTRLRGMVVSLIGAGAFQGVFSLMSIGALWLLVAAWKRTPSADLWSVDDPVRYVLAAVMLVASILFVGSVTAQNPTIVGGESALETVPQGFVQVTRHPMLWSFGLWSLVHIIANGNSAALLFFGAFAVTSFAGMPSIDAKMEKRDPARWAAFARRTSLLPMGAVVSGRLSFVADRGIALGSFGGLVLWALLLYFHPALIGVPALPA